MATENNKYLDLAGLQHLIEKLNEFLKGKRVSTKAGIYCPMLVREHKLKEELKNKKSKLRVLIP